MLTELHQALVAQVEMALAEQAEKVGLQLAATVALVERHASKPEAALTTIPKKTETRTKQNSFFSFFYLYLIVV
jgi:hypothetical protein